ncbi:MAG: HIT family protein [Firmicutes bacterium]|nr:HIT family protein [Bacillota bacterium]
MGESCIFCSDEVKKNAIMDNKLAYVVYDKYPQAQGHVLIIPKRHSENWFKTTEEEKIAVFNLIEEVKVLLDYKYGPAGYNIVMNCGKSAGQVIFHTHVHLIPRYVGDSKKIFS